MDADAKVRFRLVGKDGTILVVSKAFEDKKSAADGVDAVRECAGTGLITRARPSLPNGSSLAGKGGPAGMAAKGSPAGLGSPVHRRHRHSPAA